MKKESIKLDKYKLTKGYCHDDYDKDYNVLDKIVEFSQGKNISIYEHKIRKEWKLNKRYKPLDNSEKAKLYPALTTKIPRGDETVWLDIYYQEKL